ncbi:hypothetical protein [Exiguobacterium algae]|uniref:hypothetical protein n=1 Tax=Exiguobacterium algae TaxID=2751250 RepID=UPI001BEB784F|nr:hypothetical protein [Exiguobacterium algae]
MRSVLVFCILLLFIGNTLTLIGLTTNITGWMLSLAVIGGPVLTGVAIIGILVIFVYLKRHSHLERKQKRDNK